MAVRPAKTQISLGICPVWSKSSLSTRRKLGSLATHWVHSKDSDQTGQMLRLIRVFAGCTHTFLVLSCHGSLYFLTECKWVAKNVYKRYATLPLSCSHFRKLYISSPNTNCIEDFNDSFDVVKYVYAIWATSWENLSLGFPTRVDSNRPAQLQRPDRVLKFWI